MSYSRCNEGRHELSEGQRTRNCRVSRRVVRGSVFRIRRHTPSCPDSLCSSKHPSCMRWHCSSPPTDRSRFWRDCPADILFRVTDCHPCAPVSPLAAMPSLRAVTLNAGARPAPRASAFSIPNVSRSACGLRRPRFRRRASTLIRPPRGTPRLSRLLPASRSGRSEWYGRCPD